jgi:hypothetical protein
MTTLRHSSVAFIACRLISGRRLSGLYDIAVRREIDHAEIHKDGLVTEFDDKHRDYIPGYASECRYEFTTSDGTSIQIFINWRTFILHFRGTCDYFVGNVQRDVIYIYDHKGAAHVRYRITGCIEEKDAAGADRSGAHPLRTAVEDLNND